MANVVNLRAARKLQERAAKKAKADQNAVTFGRSKAEKQRASAEAAQALRHLEGHRRE